MRPLRCFYWKGGLSQFLLAVFWDRVSHCSGNWIQRNPSSSQKTLEDMSVLFVLKSLLQRGSVCQTLYPAAVVLWKNHCYIWGRAWDLVMILQAESLKKGIKKEKGRWNTFLCCVPCASWYCVWERWGELACPSVPEWGLLICGLHGVTWSWVMLRSHRSPGFGCWEQVPLWMLVLGCQWVWFVMTMFAETTMTVGFPMFLDRCSHKPDTSMRVTLCTGFGSAVEGLAAQNGPPLLSFLSKALCFAFSYA